METTNGGHKFVRNPHMCSYLDVPTPQFTVGYVAWNFSKFKSDEIGVRNCAPRFFLALEPGPGADPPGLTEGMHMHSTRTSAI